MSGSEATALLMANLRHMNHRDMVIANVKVGGSPWESDVVRVTKAGYWTEYEVKISLADYQADFRKRIVRRSSKSMLKHDYLKGEAAPLGWVAKIPRPKQFYFVVPKGLLDGVDPPEHCGVIEVFAARHPAFRASVTRSAPELPGHSQLPSGEVFSLGRKASHKVPLPPLPPPPPAAQRGEKGD